MSIFRFLSFRHAYIGATGIQGIVVPTTIVDWQTDRRTVQHAMLRQLVNWFRGETELEDTPVTQIRRRTSAHAAVHSDKSAQAPASDDLPEREPRLDGRVENQGPGKNVLMRKKYVREDTGTYETLKIIDDSIQEDPQIDGIDPYNSGQFDRSRHWDRRFRD